MLIPLTLALFITIAIAHHLNDLGDIVITVALISYMVLVAILQ